MDSVRALVAIEGGLAPDAEKARQSQHIYLTKEDIISNLGRIQTKVRQMIKTACSIATALCLILAAPVSAQRYEAGRIAYQAGDFATAYENWRPLAEEGHTVAQKNLGIMYFHGDGVQQDDFEAVRWLLLAAEQGNADAQVYLRFMYENGRGAAGRRRGRALVPVGR